MAQALKLKTLPAVTVATSGTRQPLSATTIMVYGVIIISLSTNTGIQYVGDSTVSTSNGAPIAPDGSWELGPPEAARGYDQFDIKDVYVDSSSNGAEFRIMAWVRG